jgi:hypothetical protein
MTGRDMNIANTEMQKIAEAMTIRLEAQYGPLLSSTALIKVLGYPSAVSFQQALHRGTVPVPVFRIQHRRGHFALVEDVARWLSEQRAQAPSLNSEPRNSLAKSSSSMPKEGIMYT